ncbi:sigma-70 family RNA polymerase sigma factor [Paludisphaera sp.]|uniref:RNA polymerase sigma factor n=1 Tax=Paludisphaera sp. TaxID=2017432 RepID=UPI00301E5186
MERPSAPSRPRRVAGDAAGETSLTLLESVRRREGDAWRRLLDLYTPLLRHWIRRWGVRPEDMDDVTQDVFQAVATSLDGFRRERERDSFRGWLHGVARHKALAHLRKSGGSGPVAAGLHEAAMKAAAPDEPPDDEERSLLSDLYRDALEAARAEFEERTWHAFWLSAVEGRAPAAIAQELGVSPAAVRQSKSRVLRRLKDLIGEPPRSLAVGPTG